MSRVDKAKLLAKRAATPSGMPEDDVDVPGQGTVRVRGLSRAEQLLTVKQGDIDAAGNPDITRVQAIEGRMLAMAMVDPEMSEDEVATWQGCGGSNEIEPVVEKIQELSGLLPGQAKELTKSVPREPRARVRTVPRAKAR